MTNILLLLMLARSHTNVIPYVEPTNIPNVTLSWSNINFGRLNSNIITTIEYSTNCGAGWIKIPVTLPYSTNCICILSNRNPSIETYRVSNTRVR